MNFDTAFERVIGHEGGYVNDPRDPGGETKYGISKRQYPGVDIAALTVEAAKEIYRRDYWDVLGEAPDAIKFQLFDFAVLAGVSTAIRKLQAAIGAADDGHWGPVSAARLKAQPPAAVIMLFNAERLDFLRKLSTWKTYGSGWAGRVAGNLRYAVRDL